MEKDFIKEVKLMDRNHADTYKDIMNNIENVKNNLDRDYKNMQFIEDRNLVDYFTYKIKAEEAQYDFLINEAKKVENERGKNGKKL